ncbi:hypothetical protein GCM10027097_10550 [Amycolatopsis acidiphila]
MITTVRTHRASPVSSIRNQIRRGRAGVGARAGIWNVILIASVRFPAAQAFPKRSPSKQRPVPGREPRTRPGVATGAVSRPVH